MNYCSLNIYGFPPLISSIFAILLGITVLLKGSRRLRKSFFLWCFTIFVWLLSYSICYFTKNEVIATLFARFACTAVMFLANTFYDFIVNFLELRQERKYVIGAYVISFVMLIFFLFSNFLLVGTYRYFWGYYSRAGMFHPVFLLFFFSIFIRGFFLLLKSYRLVKDPQKHAQIKYVFLSFLIALVAAIDFIPKYGIEFYPFGFLFMILFIGVTAYTILRYRLMDINLIITRAGVFVAVYSLILGIPFILASSFQKNFVLLFGNNWWLVPLIVSTVLATVGPFVYVYVDKKAVDKLFKEQRSYQNILRNASSGMIRIKDLSRLLDLIVHVVTKTVRIRNAAIYLLDKDNNNYVLQAIRGDRASKQVEQVVDAGSPLIWTMTKTRSFVVTQEEMMRLGDEQDNMSLLKLSEQLLNLKADLVVPSFVDERLIGFIVLGEKVSKKLYSQDDMNVFSVLANQAALAIENAQFYDEIKQTHEQLFQAEKLATIGTMADGLSHQINNRFHALSLISGDALDILNTSDLSNVSPEVKQLIADVKDALQKIQNNVLQGGEVVKGLLKYSRPGESGFEAVDFKDVLKGSLDMVQYKIKLAEIDLIEKIVPDLPKIFGNLTQLQEVFFNLIDNAYDATRERKLTLKEKDYKGRIEVIARVNEKNNIEINVIDNGMGVKDLDKKKMFTPFFTTKATAKKGTGLGLYVIKKIVSAHNGTITVGSVHGKGTHFLIELPLNREIPVKAA